MTRTETHGGHPSFTTAWRAGTLLLAGCAVALALALSMLLLTRVHLGDGYDCGYLARLVLQPAEDPGGEQTDAFFARATHGCDTVAAPFVRTADALGWTGAALVVVAVGGAVVSRRRSPRRGAG